MVTPFCIIYWVWRKPFQRSFCRRTVYKYAENWTRSWKARQSQSLAIINQLALLKNLRAWVLHILTESNKENRFQIDAQHLARQRPTRGYKQLFLYKIVAGNAKRCLYVNVKQREEWGGLQRNKPQLIIKTDLYSKKNSKMNSFISKKLTKNKMVYKNIYIA